MKHADRIRNFGKEKYVLPARRQKEKRFSIRVGDVVRELKLNGLAPAVCSALKTNAFLESNDLKLVDVTGPQSSTPTNLPGANSPPGQRRTRGAGCGAR
jgi:hypothetical protein